MTTISRSASAAVEVMPSRRLVIERGNEVVAFRRGTQSAEQVAEVAQRNAAAAEVAAASAKQLQEVKRRTSVEGMESHQMYLPNVSDLSLENAKKSLGIAQVMIENKEDVGVTINGRYGDKDISDLNSYKAALTDYISKFEAAVSKAAVGESTAPSQASTTATSIYRQMQSMVSQDANEG